MQKIYVRYSVQDANLAKSLGVRGVDIGVCRPRSRAHEGDVLMDWAVRLEY